MKLHPVTFPHKQWFNNYPQTKIAPGKLWNTIKKLQQPSGTPKKKNGHIRKGRKNFTWVTPSLSSATPLGPELPPWRKEAQENPSSFHHEDPTKASLLLWTLQPPPLRVSQVFTNVDHSYGASESPHHLASLEPILSWNNLSPPVPVWLLLQMCTLYLVHPKPVSPHDLGRRNKLATTVLPTEPVKPSLEADN